MTIDNQIDLAATLTHQAPEEFQKDFRLESLFEDHEIQTPQIRDGRNHVATEALAGAGNYGSLSPQAIGTTHSMVGSQSHSHRAQSLARHKGTTPPL